MNRKILVTGGAGYIGSHTVALLKSLGCDVLVYDSLENGFEEAIKNTRLVKGDLTDLPLLTNTLKDFQPDAVVHFAALASVPDSVINPVGYYRNNIIGGLNLLSAMKESGIRHIVYSSSASVYGNPLGALIEEHIEKNPVSPYGRTKLFFEEILKDFDKAYNFKSVSLRYFCVAGASLDGTIGESHRPETHIIPTVIRTVLGVVPQFKVFGNDFPTKDGTGVRDYIHVEDVADAHAKSVEYLLSGGSSDCFNIGTGKGYSVMEIVQSVEKVSGKKVNYTFAPRREGDPAILVANPSKIYEVMGWKARYTLSEMVSTAWEWLKDHPNGYNAVLGKVETEN